MINTKHGFKLVNTRNNMHIHLDLDCGFNILYGIVEIDKSYGSEVYKIYDVTEFENCNKEIMNNFNTKEKICQYWQVIRKRKKTRRIAAN